MTQRALRRLEAIEETENTEETEQPELKTVFDYSNDAVRVVGHFRMRPIFPAGAELVVTRHSRMEAIHR